MELKPGMSALVTGGASGIGKRLPQSSPFSSPLRRASISRTARCVLMPWKALCIAFAKKGLFVTIVDFSEENGREVTSLVQEESNKFHGDLRVPSAIFVKCDVTHADDLASSFEKHVRMYGGLDICINCAGISNKTLVYDDTSDGTKTWRHAVNVNLVAVIDGTRIAFVQTNLAEQLHKKIIDSTGGYLKMEDVVNGAFELINDESKAGACLWITKRRGMEYWPTPEERRKVVHTLSHNFRNATRLERVRFTLPIEPHSALVKVIYAGVNASDVNFSSGRYFSGNTKEVATRLPFDAGFEGVGIVASVGNLVHHVKVGTPVALMTFGSYAEFTLVPAKHLLPVPRPDPEVVAMLTSGLTASIGLEKGGQMTSGQVVLVTAAAGGTGQFAVQLAKLAGNKVVATCGGESKAALLSSLGADRVINYRNEGIKDYQGEEGWKPQNYTGLCEKILAKSQTVAGFFLIQYAHLWQDHLGKLFDLYASGKLKISLDPKKFMGVASVPDAVEYLHSGKSVGKVVVCIDPSYARTASKL
ncbi:hypothetical protein PR202_gb22408 [Eleusine coracana subsp. coracana]|uniref:Enoyl reductase (ER) domain-containing protein n=1 Tax=Eleusine coracana subsp. coracana TaxID=191504 RepID=A0AAV5FFQ1_ELECO|nr:hypothetical protein PR202_gb22408 [Eleusine coracana subsp. coracana]